MYDTEYNRDIARRVLAINKRHLASEEANFGGCLCEGKFGSGSATGRDFGGCGNDAPTPYVHAGVEPVTDLYPLLGASQSEGPQNVPALGHLEPAQPNPYMNWFKGAFGAVQGNGKSCRCKEPQILNNPVFNGDVEGGKKRRGKGQSGGRVYPMACGIPANTAPIFNEGAGPKKRGRGKKIILNRKYEGNDPAILGSACGKQYNYDSQFKGACLPEGGKIPEAIPVLMKPKRVYKKRKNIDSIVK